jgi:hypothetical protein
VKLEFSGHKFKKYSYIKVYENPFSGIDGHDEAAGPPKNVLNMATIPLDLRVKYDFHSQLLNGITLRSSMLNVTLIGQE